MIRFGSEGGWFVYLVSEQGGDFCKVGRTKDVERRMGYLATSNPRKLSVEMVWEFSRRADAIDVERLALEGAAPVRVRRSEWLSCSVHDAFRIVEDAIGEVMGAR